MTLFARTDFAPPGTPLRRFWANNQDLCDAVGLPSRHGRIMDCLHCELLDLLEASRPPDPELVDLIEQAYLEGRIDSASANLTYLWLLGRQQIDQ